CCLTCRAGRTASSCAACWPWTSAPAAAAAAPRTCWATSTRSSCARRTSAASC
ncbi:hypothetical protein H4R21_006539, partial [Coemansia helicoidea]